MVLLSIDPMRDGYTSEKAQALFEKLPERLRDSGTVSSFALAAQPPFSIEDEDAAIQLTAEDSRGGARGCSYRRLRKLWVRAILLC